MFQKKEYIFSESLGVCRVDDIAKLSSKNEEQRLYYVLKPEFDRTKTSYIPVEGHKVLLRELISKERAEELLKQGLPDIEQDAELGEIAYVLGRSLEELKESKNREE